jgi:geranylgeranyl pyrophosphate synthase
MTSQETRDTFERFLHQKVDECFPALNEINHAVRYSLLAPGKRIRPFLTLALCDFFQGNLEVALRCGVAIEMIHCYSLIHDDLPAMDNDDFRRGQPSCHKKFSESTAILAGDALLTMAPLFLLKELPHHCSPERAIELTQLLLSSSSHEGMIQGQMMDIEQEAKEHSNSASQDLETLKKIHALKTGELFTFSCLAGLYSSPDDSFINLKKEFVLQFSKRLGLCFQIIDDILDESSAFEDLGKTPGKDKDSGKLTYVKFFGLEGAKKEAHALLNQLEESLQAESSVNKTALIKTVISDLRKKIA